jgi:hypothetical protein
MGSEFFYGKIISCLLAALLLMNSAAVFAFDHQHHILTQVLSDVVKLSSNKKQTRVDYGLLFKQPYKLNEYLAVLSSIKKSEYVLWTGDEQLSFLINAYNGFTLQLINQNYAKFENGKAESIKDLGSFFYSPWKKSFFTLLDEKRNLDDVEHNMIRVWFERPRIHAAVVCAAVSCPPLRNEAFVADKLDLQLDDQMRKFLSDDQSNTINIRENRVRLSSIFKWYAEDFEKGQQGFNSLKDLIELYQADIANDPQQLNFLQKQGFSIRYLDYDWRLNDISTF